MDNLFNTFVVLFIVIDPLGIIPIFVGLTHGNDAQWQRRMAIRGILLATVILVSFYLVGNMLLERLGVGIEAFRIAGGILLFLLAIDMIFARQSGLRSTTHREQQEAQHKTDVSVFPLAFPLIAGPGSLTTVLLMSTASQPGWFYLANLGIVLAVLAITLVMLLIAPRLMRLLGETGANVISRLFGLILAALAVQFILDGLKASFPAG